MLVWIWFCKSDQLLTERKGCQGTRSQYARLHACMRVRLRAHLYADKFQTKQTMSSLNAKGNFRFQVRKRSAPKSKSTIKFCFAKILLRFLEGGRRGMGRVQNEMHHTCSSEERTVCTILIGGGQQLLFDSQLVLQTVPYAEVCL